MSDNKPNIFIVSDVITIFDKSINELTTIKQSLSSEPGMCTWNLKSTYTYIYSIFETTLYQTYYRILIAFPESIKNHKIDNIGDIISSYSFMTPLVEVVASSFARNFAYGKIKDIFKDYNDVVKIGLNIKDCKFLDELEKYKCERNLLVHQGTCPDKLDYIKVVERIDFIIEILEIIKKKFRLKYNEYTKINLIKKSWFYVFGDKVPFESCFILNKDGELYSVNSEYIDRRTRSLSHSEKVLIVLFMTNYSSWVLDNAMRIKDLCTFASLSQITKNKIGFILELFHRYPTLLLENI